MVHAFAIEPLLPIEFGSEAELVEQCREWGLLSEKASKSKTFYYKGRGLNEVVSIVGYVDKLTTVIEFENKQRHCIHPSYLKEMQASTFGQKFSSRAETEGDSGAEAEMTAETKAEANASAYADAIEEAAPESADAIEPAPAESAAPIVQAAPAESADAAAKPEAVRAPATEPGPAAAPAPEPKAAPPEAKAPKGKAKKIELPEDKVKMVATVQKFTTVPNHFSDNDDEVVIYEAVSVLEPELELGEAWSSYSATIKKLELAVGDTIAFEAKVIAKKLTKHPVAYKINNPAKIQKQ